LLNACGNTQTRRHRWTQCFYSFVISKKTEAA